MKITNFQTTGRVLTLTVGLPASGKTCWSRSAGFDATISLDDCRQSLWGDTAIQDGPGGIPAIVDCQMQALAGAMRNNQSIVVHNTNITREHRRPLIDAARQAGYRVQIVYFDIPIAVCRHRNRHRTNPVPESVIDDFAAQLEIPQQDEADLVIRYSGLPD